LNWKPEK